MVEHAAYGAIGLRLLQEARGPGSRLGMALRNHDDDIGCLYGFVEQLAAGNGLRKIRQRATAHCESIDFALSQRFRPVFSGGVTGQARLS